MLVCLCVTRSLDHVLMLTFHRSTGEWDEDRAMQFVEDRKQKVLETAAANFRNRLKKAIEQHGEICLICPSLRTFLCPVVAQANGHREGWTVLHNLEANRCMYTCVQRTQHIFLFEGFADREHC